MTYNQMSCISYILETERTHFEEFVDSLDGQEKEIADRFLQLDKIEGVELDEEIVNFLNSVNHVYGLAVLAINGK
jgi:glycerol-3-phosphate responsive antiterminator